MIFLRASQTALPKFGAQFFASPWGWWAGFSLSLFLPTATLAFLAQGPWPWWQALAWTLPVWLLIAADYASPALTSDPPPALPRWPFDGILYALCLLQPLNILAMALLVAQTHWDTPAQALESLANLTAVRVLLGTNSCCAAIAPAHELIHRKARWQRGLGRLLLCTVLYDHFALVHRRQHHGQLGGTADPSTAAPDESYPRFLHRTVAAQWRAAWRLNRRGTLAGVAAQSALTLYIGWVFGPLALVMFLYQALAAVRLLEAVNYFQHWGLGGRREAAWVCDNAVSLFLLLGLPRHIDHHRHGRKPYQALQHIPQGPRLWHGYLGMALLVKNRDAAYRRVGRNAIAVPPLETER